MVGTSKGSKVATDTRTERAGRPTAGPYGRAARDYWRAGFTCPLPLPAGHKESPPTGYTGADARLVSFPDLQRWERSRADGNIALRLVGSMIGIDVDAYGKKVGGRVLAAAEAELGELPQTYVSSARDDGVSGIRLFRLPEGLVITKEAEHRLAERFGIEVETNGHVRKVSNIEIIRPDHRYMVVWPSTNPDADGAPYVWETPDGEPLEGVPDGSLIPVLPGTWAEFLCSAKPAAAGVKRHSASMVSRPQTVDRPVDDEDDEDADMIGAGNGEREYTAEEFAGFLRRGLAEIRSAPRGTINQTLNDQAVWLWHFAPGFIDEKELARKLVAAQRDAWVAGGGTDDGDYTAARKTVRSARAAARASWTAVPAEDDDGPDPMEAILDEAAQDGGEQGRNDGAGAGGGDDGDGATFAEDEKTSTKRSGIFFTDARFSEAVAELLREEGYVYTAEMGWMAWDGQRWDRELDGDGKAVNAVRKWVIKRWRKAKKKLDEAEEAGDVPVQEIHRLEALVEAWHTMLSRNRRTSVVADARPQVQVKPEVFDNHPDLLNTPSGVVDLRTGEVRKHDPKLYLTKITRAPYRGTDYQHELWEKALDAIPADTREWVQVFMGQGCTGRRNTEGRLLLLDGDGENGKGALTNEGAVWALGDYAVVLSETLLMANSSQHPTEKMALRGARLTLIDETPEARRLDTQRLKKLLDQPVLAGARYLYKEEVKVELQHTMIVSTNYLPAVTEFDHGTWRRLTRLRMPYKFVKPSKWDRASAAPHERLGDPTLKPALTEDEDVQAACLAWLVTGAMKWYAAGRQQGEESERVAADTRGWRLQGDLIMNYVDEFMEFGTQQGSGMVHVWREEVYRHFCAWAEANGHKPWSVKTFTSRWEQHEAVSGRTTVAKTKASGSWAPCSRPPDVFASNDLALPGNYWSIRGIKYRDEAPSGPVELDDEDDD